jgi:hypothetical protein
MLGNDERNSKGSADAPGPVARSAARSLPGRLKARVSAAVRAALRSSARKLPDKLKVSFFAAVTLALMSASLTTDTAKSFEQRLADYTSTVHATLLTAALTWLAVAVCGGVIWLQVIKEGSFAQRSIEEVGRRFVWLAGMTPGSVRGSFKKFGVRLGLASAATAAVLYVTLPETNLWRLLRLWWGGPQIELTSRSSDNSFQPMINLPWVSYGQDFGAVAGWKWQGVSQNRAALDATFARLRRSGVKCVVWFLFSDGRGAPSFDSAGYVSGMGQGFWLDYDAAIEVARKHQVGIVWVLLDFHWFSKARQEADASLGGHADVIQDESKRESFYQKALIPLLRRHSYEPQIAGWILVNEPENALKAADLHLEPLAKFVREASALIKKYTYRQPVSVGSADLESLLEYWGKESDGLDFLVFHHYEKFLPPPADHVRGLLVGANDRPIYIGEFKIDDPPIPIDDFIAWTRAMGYAGLWAWRLNEDTAPPRYEEAVQIRDAMTAANSGAGYFRAWFRARRLPEAAPADERFERRRIWWRQHGSETVLPAVSADVTQWEAEASDLEKQTGRLTDERKAKEIELKEKVAECFRQNGEGLKRSKEAVERLNAQTADYNEQLRQARENGDRAWEGRVLSWSQEAERNQEAELGNVSYYERATVRCEEWQREVESRIQEINAEIDSQTALANWYRYKSRWSRKLYQEFWRAELQR